MEIKTNLVTAPMGLGDIAGAAFSATGVKAVVEKLHGGPCGGCQKRAELINRLPLRFAPKTVYAPSPWGVPPGAPEGWTLDPDRSTATSMTFRHQKGAVVIWEVVDGRYCNGRIGA